MADPFRWLRRRRSPSYDDRFRPSDAARGVSRRRLLTRVGWGSFFLSVGAFVSSVASFVIPKLNYEPSSVFSIGRPEDYRIGDMRLLESQAVFVFRTERGFQVVSDICTHLGCAYQPYGPPSEQIPQVHAFCPCHGSYFARDGRVLGGPAPRPVPFYHMGMTPDGRIEVDKAAFNPTEELAAASGEGIGHNLYLDPDSGELIEGPYPDGSDCRPCQG